MPWTLRGTGSSTANRSSTGRAPGGVAALESAVVPEGRITPSGALLYVRDPLGEKYYGVNPYAYCSGDPVNFVDIDGQEISKWKEFLFALKHPKAANNIGRVVKGKKQTNISTNTVRFATRGQVLKGSRNGESEQMLLCQCFPTCSNDNAFYEHEIEN